MNYITFRTKTLLLCGAIWSLASCATDTPINNGIETNQVVENAELESRTTESFCQDYQNFSQQFCSGYILEELQPVFQAFTASGGGTKFKHGVEFRAVELKSSTQSLLLSVNYDVASAVVSTITEKGELAYDVILEDNTKMVGLKKLIRDLSTVRSQSQADEVIKSSLPPSSAEFGGKSQKFSTHQVPNSYLSDVGGGPGYDELACPVTRGFISSSLANYLLNASGATYSPLDFASLRSEILNSMDSNSGGCGQAYGSSNLCKTCNDNISCPMVAGLDHLSTILSAQELTNLADFVAADLFKISPGTLSSYINSQPDNQDAALTMMLGMFTGVDVSECDFLENIYNVLINSTVLESGDAYFQGVAPPCLGSGNAPLAAMASNLSVAPQNAAFFSPG